MLRDLRRVRDRGPIWVIGLGLLFALILRGAAVGAPARLGDGAEIVFCTGGTLIAVLEQGGERHVIVEVCDEALSQAAVPPPAAPALAAPVEFSTALWAQRPLSQPRPAPRGAPLPRAPPAA